MLSSHLNICLIDDDRIYQFTAKKTIESMNIGGNISVFSNGEEALKHLVKHCLEAAELPDIIFLDINMPVMDGWQFLEAYKEIKGALSKPILIYMVSSSVDNNDMLKSKNYYGVDDYIIKPVHREKYKEILQPFADA